MNKVEGADKIIKRLTYLTSKEQRQVLQRSMKKSSSVFVKSAKRLAPKQEGDLRKSIGSINIKSSQTVVKVGVGILKGKQYRGWYGHIVEFGYGRQTPQPFFRKALKDGKKQFMSDLRQNISDATFKKLEKL